MLKNATSLESEGKNYTIYFSPSKMPLNEYFDMDVQVRNSMKQIIKFPLTIEIDAGMNVKPKIEDLGYGQYKIKGMLLHMSGEWFLNFTLRRGALSEKAETNLIVSH
jgi:hypothetical protein